MQLYTKAVCFELFGESVRGHRIRELLAAPHREPKPPLRLLCALVALFGGYLMVRLLAENKKYGCGTELVIESYHRRSGFLSLRDTVSKTLASAVTIGFGGSAGLKGPSLLLGGGISSFITRRLGLGQEDVKRMFLCGAAAGFSAIFRALLTGYCSRSKYPTRGTSRQRSSFQPP